eukprot:TRINITY_DN68166_c0_g1_i1.p1 TRINITY_DN68166_c0_g1~~TRINITY_DN68166_c0_g1_i1.p1  ORF type:complete len:107 (-),score=14.83 TRINITY_DN68166_c0_g1_i1:277-597(-)
MLSTEVGQKANGQETHRDAERRVDPDMACTDADREEVHKALNGIAELLSDSSDSVYSSVSVAELTEMMSRSLKTLEKGHLSHEQLAELSLEFAPTSSLDDVSIDNR